MEPGYLTFPTEAILDFPEMWADSAKISREAELTTADVVIIILSLAVIQHLWDHG